MAAANLIVAFARRVFDRGHRSLRLVLTSLAVIATFSPVGGVDFALATNVELTPGQIWSIRSASPTSAKVIIGRVEPWLDRVSVHVSIIDIPIPEGAPGAGGTTSIAHVPFDEQSFLASLDKLLGSDASPLPNFDTGFQQWRDDSGGVFTLSVSDTIALIFSNL